VASLVRWLANRFLAGDQGAILIDSACRSTASRPPAINGCVPDVFIPECFIRRLVIGEAKTKEDLDSRHTVAQFEGLLRWCSLHPGSLFTLAVPWDVTVLGRHVLRDVGRLVDVSKVEVVVLDPRVDLLRRGP